MLYEAYERAHADILATNPRVRDRVPGYRNLTALPPEIAASPRCSGQRPDLAYDRSYATGHEIM